MDTSSRGATGIHVGDKLPMLNREFRVAGICRAGAGGRLYARLPDVQEAIGTPRARPRSSWSRAESAREAESSPSALQERFKGHKITPVAQVSKVMQDNAVGLKQFKEALTGMAVVISFLVVLLAMYTTIIERTREIGILRAIGASQGKVVQLVINESIAHLPGRCGGRHRSGRSEAAGSLPRIFPTLAVQLTREWALIASALGPRRRPARLALPGGTAARMDPVQALNFE